MQDSIVQVVQFLARLVLQDSMHLLPHPRAKAVQVVSMLLLDLPLLLNVLLAQLTV